MASKPTAYAGPLYGVTWIDTLLGPLALARPDAAAAIELAATIRAKGADKVTDVRAFYQAADGAPLQSLEA